MTTAARHAAPFRSLSRLLWAPLIAMIACSPGTLPGSPTPFAPGGGSRYSGTMTIFRSRGSAQFDTGPRPLDMSLVVAGDQLSGQFAAGDASGSLTAQLAGTMSSGTFNGQLLLNLPATQGGILTTCEGIQNVRGTFAGKHVEFLLDTLMGFRNCGDLLVNVTAAADATSPVPSPIGNRANLIVSVTPGRAIAEGGCDGDAGFGFTINLVETAGVPIEFDETYRVFLFEGPSTEFQMPVTTIEAGARRAIAVCSASSSLFQAVFTGRDGNGNLVNVASPVLTLGTPGQLANWGTFATAVIAGGPQLQVCVRDYFNIDGDILRLSVNGAVVIESELMLAPFCQNLTFQLGANTITAFAVTEGTEPPNSGEVTVSAIDAAGNAVASTSRIQTYLLPVGQSSSSSINVTAP